jgi:hypothetical protein
MHHDLINIIRAEIREAAREDAEVALYEAKTNRAAAAMLRRSQGEQLVRAIVGAVIFGVPVWGIIAWIGIGPALITAAALTGAGFFMRLDHGTFT